MRDEFFELRSIAAAALGLDESTLTRVQVRQALTPPTATPAALLRMCHAVIDRHAPEGADKVDILRRRGLIVATLTTTATRRVTGS